MGSSLNKISSCFSKHEQTRILLCGLDAAGKTTVLYASKLGEIVTTIPTIGFNVETVTVGNLQFTAWDVGGRDKIRPLWRHYFANTSALVFVVDSNDRERVQEASEELHKMVNEDELRDIPVLIFANKQDLPNRMSLDELKEKLNLTKLDERKIPWHLQPSTAMKNQGLQEGFQWLSECLQSKRDLLKPIKETMNDSKIMTHDLLHIWKSTDFRTFISKFI